MRGIMYPCMYRAETAHLRKVALERREVRARALYIVNVMVRRPECSDVRARHACHGKQKVYSPIIDVMANNELCYADRTQLTQAPGLRTDLRPQAPRVGAKTACRQLPRLYSPLHLHKTHRRERRPLPR